MLDFAGRFGLLVLAAIIVFLAKRLHDKSGGGKAKKNAAAVFAFLGGLCLLGTVVGDWMGKITGASPYIAAGLFLLTAGIIVIDMWADKKADKPAFWCAVVLPLAIVFGLSQMSNVGATISKNAGTVGSTIQQGTTSKRGR